MLFFSSFCTPSGALIKDHFWDCPKVVFKTTFRQFQRWSKYRNFTVFMIIQYIKSKCEEIQVIAVRLIWIYSEIPLLRPPKIKTFYPLKNLFWNFKLFFSSFSITSVHLIRDHLWDYPKVVFKTTFGQSQRWSYYRNFTVSQLNYLNYHYHVRWTTAIFSYISFKFNYTCACRFCSASTNLVKILAYKLHYFMISSFDKIIDLLKWNFHN